MKPAHRHPIDVEIDTGDDGPVFHLGPTSTAGSPDHADDLVDNEIDRLAPSLVGEHPDVFQAHQSPEDFTRVGEDKGASCLLGHTSSLERLCSRLADHRPCRLPTNIRRATQQKNVPPAGLEPALPAPEAGALSAELRGRHR